MLSSSRRQMALRENAKIPIVLIFDELRRVIEAAASLLIARGVVGNADDIVYLRYDELKDVLGGAAGPGPDEIRRRRREHKSCLQLEVPELVEPGPGFMRHVTEAHITERGLLPPTVITELTTVLTGVGASSGRVTAVARVMSDPFDDDFEPGDVLIAKTVDPGWAAALSCAGAVVHDIGGESVTRRGSCSRTGHSVRGEYQSRHPGRQIGRIGDGRRHHREIDPRGPPMTKYYNASDEGTHEPDSSDPDWQESVFVHWYDVGQKVGGVHRIGHEPNRAGGRSIVPGGVSGMWTVSTPGSRFTSLGWTSHSKCRTSIR